MTPCMIQSSIPKPLIPGRIHPNNKFTSVEDVMLREAVKKHGTNDWKVVAKELPGRNPRQCKDRWQGYLSPDISNEPWTQYEDEMLVEKYKEFGPKWKYISTFFKNRTDINIKNRWQFRQRRLKKEEMQKSRAVIDDRKCCKNTLHNNTNMKKSLPIPIISQNKFETQDISFENFVFSNDFDEWDQNFYLNPDF